MNKTKSIAMAALTVSVQLIFAQDKDVVVSANRVVSSSDSIASSVSVITSDDISRKKKSTALELLREVPGVHVTQNGGSGTLGSVFVRGAETEQTLVIVDGVEINDPISAGRAAFLSNIDVDNIERIEVVRGSQSSLYGSDALAGVISITTKKGDGSPRSYISVEGGSYNTFKESAGLSGSKNGTYYSLSFSRFDTDGISAANEKDGNTERDSADLSTVSARLGRELNDMFSFDLTARYIDSSSEFDDNGGAGGDAEDNISKRESLLVSASADVDLCDSVWQQKYRVSYADHDRSSKSSYADSTFDSSLLKEEWQNDIYHGDGSVLTLGVEMETEEGQTDSIAKLSSDTLSLFAQEIVSWEALTMALGIRYDDRDHFGEETTYRAAPIYRIKRTATSVKGTYGTGIKTPSLYQLYAPAGRFGPVGNIDLKPEKSEGWDAGIDQEFCDGDLVVGVTYFAIDYEDMIDYEAGYVNKSEVETSGVELSVRMKVNEDVAVSGHYTYLDTKDKVAGEKLTRRPDNRVVIDVSYDCSEKANITVGCLYVDDRTDKYYDSAMFGFVTDTLDDYLVVNAAVSYDLNDSVELFGRIDNLFDEEYEEVIGYGTPGLSGYAGVKVSL